MIYLFYLEIHTITAAVSTFVPHFTQTAILVRWNVWHNWLFCI